MDDRPRLLSPRIVIQLLVFIVIVPLLPLLITWRWDWWQAWVYAGVCIMSFIVSRLLAARHHPDLLSERGRGLRQADAESYDKILAPIVGLGGALVPLIASLDGRFAWSPGFGLAIELLGLVAIVAGYALSSWALITNRYFSGMVRIQADRDHHVVTSGPYSWVRHPGYAGGLLSYMGMPLLLNSAWAFVPVALLLVALVVRTYLEDRTLQDKLQGYREYAQRVRYRLLPGLF